eukprot:757811-Hanusia_phi.AAC.1
MRLWLERGRDTLAVVSASLLPPPSSCSLRPGPPAFRVRQDPAKLLLCAGRARRAAPAVGASKPGTSGLSRAPGTAPDRHAN